MRSVTVLLALLFVTTITQAQEQYVWLVDRTNSGLFYEEFARELAAGPHKDMLASGTNIDEIGARRNDMIVSLVTQDRRVGDTKVTVVSIVFLQWQSVSTFFYFGQYVGTFVDPVSMKDVVKEAVESTNERISAVMKK